jgi:hypothetical protein
VFDAPVVTDGQDAEVARFLYGYLDTADGDVGTASAMLFEHGPVVHPVDMVPGENEHEPGVDFVDEIEIAIDGVGGTAIAAVRRERVGGPWNDDGAAQRTIPSSGEMREQRRRLVLRRDADGAHAGIHAVGQREVDAAEGAAERQRRLADVACERIEASAVTAGEHDGERVVGKSVAGHEVSFLLAPLPCPS